MAMRHIAAAFSLAFAGALLSMAPVAQASNDTTNVVPTAVALSYQGSHLALIASVDGSASKLVLAGPSGGNAHVVPIPGDCTPTSIRWAPNWDRLAVVTDCPEGSDSHARTGAIWLLEGRLQKLRQLANVIGSARDVDWTSDGKNIAVLYAPDVHGSRVALVPITGGTPHVVTPAGLDVREFRYTEYANILLFTAVPVTPGAALPALYVLRPGTPDAPTMAFDPNVANGSLHNLYVTQPQMGNGGRDLLVFLGKSSARNPDGNLYLVPASKQDNPPINLNPKLRLASYSFEGGFSPGGVGTLATQLVDGETEVVKFFISGTYAQKTGEVFTLPGTITDGQGTQSIATAQGRSSGNRIAFLQEPSPGGPVVVRAGLISTQPPPVIRLAVKGAETGHAASDRAAIGDSE